MATNAQLSRLAIVAIALLLLLPLLTMLFAWPLMGMGWWMHGPVATDGQVGPGGFGGTTPTWLFGFWIVGLLVVVGAGYLLYRGVSNSGHDPALEELRRAYARGDLSDEEFEERRQRLRE
jgi:putative membrane protein